MKLRSNDYSRYTEEMISKGLSIVYENTITVMDGYGGIPYTFTAVKFKGNKKNRGFTEYYTHPSTVLHKCNHCGALASRKWTIYDMPWFHRYADMRRKYNAELRRLEYKNTSLSSCLKCLGAYYKVFKIEFENLEIKSQLTLLRKEIKCQSKQPAT